MVTSADKILAGKWALRRDAVAYFETRQCSVAAFARGAGVAEKLVRGIVDPDGGWDPSLRTLLMIEDAYRADAAWPGHAGLETEDVYDADGFVVRRRFEPVPAAFGRSEADFPDILEAWRQAAAGSDAALDRLAAYPNVTSIDVSAPDPMDYMVVRHAAESRRASGVDKTRMCLRDTAANICRKAQLRDYLVAAHGAAALAQDIVWLDRRTEEGRIYRRVLAPVRRAALLMSVVRIYESRVAGSVAYSSSISRRDM